MFSLEDGSEMEMVPDAPEFLEMSLTYRMKCPGRFLATCFITELTTSFGYSLSIRSCLTVLILLLKSF
jgi:hypothetical protein